MHDYSHINLRAGTAGGTILVFVANIHGDDIIRTMLLSLTGAVVSFFVSLLLKWLLRKRRMP